MADLFRVATRKGLFAVRRTGSEWRLEAPAFLGEPVSALLHDRRDGTLYAALNLGHFGVKLHRSDDGGGSWEELPAPAFPPAGDTSENPPTVALIWTLAAGAAGEPGVLWAGTIPGALFRSGDRGNSWSLVESLWRSEREWFGGGNVKPAMHSVSIDLGRDIRRSHDRRVSCGGVWLSEDGGASWSLGGHGLRAAYMPPELAGQPQTQDPHRLAHCRAAPGRVWCQHHNGMFLSDDSGATFRDRPSGALGLRLRGRGAPAAQGQRLVRAGGEGRVPRAGRGPLRGAQERRRRAKLHRLRRGAAAGTELRPGLSPRARRRR